MALESVRNSLCLPPLISWFVVKHNTQCNQDTHSDWLKHELREVINVLIYWDDIFNNYSMSTRWI